MMTYRETTMGTSRVEAFSASAAGIRIVPITFAWASPERTPEAA